MRFKLIGKERDTGEPVSLTIEAATQTEAVQQANRMNVAVERLAPILGAADPPRQTSRDRTIVALLWAILISVTISGAIVSWSILDGRIKANRLIRALGGEDAVNRALEEWTSELESLDE